MKIDLKIRLKPQNYKTPGLYPERLSYLFFHCSQFPNCLLRVSESGDFSPLLLAKLQVPLRGGPGRSVIGGTRLHADTDTVHPLEVGEPVVVDPERLSLVGVGVRFTPTRMIRRAR